MEICLAEKKHDDARGPTDYIGSQSLGRRQAGLGSICSGNKPCTSCSGGSRYLEPLREIARTAKLLQSRDARGRYDVGNWELWFAWRPVRFYGCTRIAWLRTISRRIVLTGPKHFHREYTDTPTDFPAGYGLRKG